MMGRVTDHLERPSRVLGRVLVVGDANPDLILRGDVVPRFGQAEQLLDDAALVVGGSAAITAHGLARLGRPVSLLAAVGDDPFARLVVGDLAAAGVDTDGMLVRAGVRTGITVVLSTPDDRALLTLPAAIPTLRAKDVRRTLRTPDLAHVHFSSLFLQPALAGELSGLLPELSARGLTTSLDTNADPAGRWRGVTALLPQLDLLRPNHPEVCAIAGNPDPVAAATTLAAAGPLVVVKDGVRGAFAVTSAGHRVTAAGEPRPVVDTTGAGDTFNAAFLDSWLAGCGLDGCLRRAVRAGTFSVTAAGGTASQPDRQDLQPDRNDT